MRFNENVGNSEMWIAVGYERKKKKTPSSSTVTTSHIIPAFISICILFTLLNSLSASAVQTLVEAADFGVKCDGVTDQTEKLQTVFRNAATNVPSIVVLPSGTCLIRPVQSAGNLPVLPVIGGMTVKGNNTVLKYTNEINDVVKASDGSLTFKHRFRFMMGIVESYNSRSHRDIIIQNLTFDGSSTFKNYSNVIESQNVLVAFRSGAGSIENVLLNSVKAINSNGDAISIGRGATGIAIKNCTVDNYLRQGIGIGGSGDTLIKNTRTLWSDTTLIPGGNGIHVEAHLPVGNVTIEDSYVRRGISVTGHDRVRGLILTGNNRIYGGVLTFFTDLFEIQPGTIVYEGNVGENPSSNGRLIYLRDVSVAKISGVTLSAPLAKLNGILATPVPGSGVPSGSNHALIVENTSIYTNGVSLHAKELESVNVRESNFRVLSCPAVANDSCNSVKIDKVKDALLESMSFSVPAAGSIGRVYGSVGDSISVLNSNSWGQKKLFHKNVKLKELNNVNILFERF